MTKQFSDFKVNQEQSMCGFRSEKELGYVYGFFLLLAIIALIK